MYPCICWAGGKRQILDRILPLCPRKYNTYYEPFIGGGTVLLTLQPNQAVISDTNPQLVNMYTQIRDDVNSVIDFLEEVESVIPSQDYYLEIREKYNEKILNSEIDAESAALFIWITKNCFNGLYRINSKGLFNVSWGGHTHKIITDKENLQEISQYLSTRDIDIKLSDYKSTCENVKDGDFVYLDPPYIPISASSSFTSYTKEGFNYEDNLTLSNLFKDLDERGAFLILSNNDVPLIYELYSDYNIQSIDVRRTINSVASKRVGKEVLITNYKVAPKREFRF